ncbi:uncharacterized protein LOC113865322 [Abrus precatorius]|uniref:Uncharacterized protein LOC113865322 n=1 Tax=Abrus precatorius TaxID=3816 RepID=A0A8B8LHM7_ABRPR|nr:uncharacterized protein LOC113865322 [Abrus precatorius]
MGADSDPLTCYSQTHRIVLLIDLDPLLNNHNTNTYIKALICALKTLLSFPPLSSSLFAFKPFFSSLSPLLSASKLHPFLPNSSHSLSFDHPSHTLTLLSHTLSSLPSFPQHHRSPKASHLASSLSQLLHDYPWEHPDHAPQPVPHNLVLLFSPTFSTFLSLASFLHAQNDVVSCPSSFGQTLLSVFGNVSRAFTSKGIYCSWVGVNGVIETDIQNYEVREIHRLFEVGLRSLGWGFCGLDSILLGSGVVPFGLVYPKIGVSWGKFCCSERDVRAELSLGILDVNGRPIEYNCCDLEFVDLKVLDRGADVWGNSELSSLQGGGCERMGRFWELCLGGIVRLEVKVVRRCDAFVNVGEWLSESVLVREVLGELKKKNKEGFDEVFADRVLELVACEFGCQWRRKSVPVWQMLLSFLYKEGYWALVSVTNDKGGSCLGVLRPFTVFSALLSVLGDPLVACDFGEANVAQYVRMVDDEICKPVCKFNKNEGHQKKKRMDLNMIQNHTWSSFCNSVYDQFEIDLLEVYYALECNKSKKLKFLKCWMKQMKKSGCWDLALTEKLKPNLTDVEELNSKLNDLTQNRELPISSFASAETNPEPEAMRIQDETELDFKSETSEAFFSNLSNKINWAVESEVIDLGALATRLVTSSIHWLCQKVDRQTISQSHSPLKDYGTCGGMIASELIKLLLREPKEITAKHKSQNPFSEASNSVPATSITEHVVREYELQILFRMEILLSEVGTGVEDSNKQKFVRQICLLLESIQCHMKGGFFGDWNLENYVAKTIKDRYSLGLEDVVQKIYNKMDLLLFADEDEAPHSLLNSEDSNKSLNKKAYRDEVGENDVSNEPVSAENESYHLQKDESGRFQRNLENEHKKIIEAKERRERARRFSSFTSWMPDLQRVWAPKQKVMKTKTGPLRKVSKGKERQRASYGTVCETPMAGNKRSNPWTSGSDDDNHLANGSQTSGSVSKALFKDDL